MSQDSQWSEIGQVDMFPFGQVPPDMLRRVSKIGQVDMFPFGQVDMFGL